MSFVPPSLICKTGTLLAPSSQDGCEGVARVLRSRVRRAGPEKAFGAAAVVVTNKGHTGVQNGSFLEKAMPGWRPKR